MTAAGSCSDESDGGQPPTTPLEIGFPDEDFEDDVIVILHNDRDLNDALEVSLDIGAVEGVRNTQVQREPLMILVDVNADADESEVAAEITKVDGVATVGNEVPRPK
ncbi:MAG: hypothetical protein ACOYXM_04250 [Actinomycetota bacterium]